MRRFAIRLSLPLLLAAACARPLLAAEPVVLLLSERGGAYAEVADAIRREAGTGAEIAQYVVPELVPLAGARPRLMVAVGTQACSVLAGSALSAPVLCTLLPRAAFERIADAPGAKGRGLSALVMDQPLARQLSLVRIAFPERKVVAALLGPESAAQEAPLVAAAAQHGMRLSRARVESPEMLHNALQRVLAEGEVLLALPDNMVYSAGTIQNILRSSVQRRVPLVGFSPAYVRAGAVIALYSTPGQIGAQAGQSVRAAVASKAPPRVQSPRQFEIAVNRHVARALGVQLADEAAMAERLRQAEENR